MYVSGKGVGVGVGLGVGVGVGVAVGVGEGTTDGVGETFDSVPEGFGPGHAVRRRAIIAAYQTRFPNWRGESVGMKVGYLACQAIAVRRIQIPLKTIIGIAGIGFFLVA
jgi:hypothetical protein